MSLSARMLAVAARSRQEAKELREAAQQEAAELVARAEKMAQQLEESAARLESQAGERMDLTTPQDDATLATKMQPQTRETRVSRARLLDENRRHPFVAALVKKCLTVEQFAKSIGYSRSTVQSWYTADGNGRPIPRRAAEEIRDQLGVPTSVWRRIVD